MISALPTAKPQINLPISKLGKVVSIMSTIVPMIAITSKIIIAFLIPRIISIIYLLNKAPNKAPKGIKAVIRAVLSM